MVAGLCEYNSLHRPGGGCRGGSVLWALTPRKPGDVVLASLAQSKKQALQLSEWFESAENRREGDLNRVSNGVIHQIHKPNDLAGTPDRSPAVSESPRM